MKVSVVISIKNRIKLFRRSLKLYNKQTMPKENWELVIVDDNSNEDVLGTLKQHASNLNWQYIKMDSHKSDLPVFWGPALSNNIGFKAAKGEAIAIAGPEIMMKETALDIGYKHSLQGVSVYGHIFHSNKNFIALMDHNPNMEDYNFDRLFAVPHARVHDITKNTFYWFFMITLKKNIMKIKGVPEILISGIVADDDITAHNLNLIGATCVHNYDIIGIHQDHSLDDANDSKRKRGDKIWEEARIRNTKILEDVVNNKTLLTNNNRDWGSDNLILSKENNYFKYKI